MRWSYKTVHFSLKKEGLLGSAFIDENEIEVSLNEYGKLGWELVSFMEVNDGLIAVFKQPFGQELTVIDEDPLEDPIASEEIDEATKIIRESFAATVESETGEEDREDREISPVQDFSEGPGSVKEKDNTPEADVGSIRIL